MKLPNFLQSGDTIIEVMVSVTVLTAVLSYGYVSSSHSLQSGYSSANRSEALSVAQGQIEWLVNAQKANPAALDSYTADSLSGKYFCISQTDGSVNTQDVDQKTKVCPHYTSANSAYGVGIIYSKDTKTFTVTSKWQRQDAVQDQLTLYYKLPGTYVAISPPAPPPNSGSEVPPVAVDDGTHYYLSNEEVAQIKDNIFTKKYGWAVQAWNNTKKAADAALSSGASPAKGSPTTYLDENTSASCIQPSGTTLSWFNCLYNPGKSDGFNVLNLARAYAITDDLSKKAQYGNQAKAILMAWATTYNPPSGAVGHEVAEPVGFMVKGFLAFDLVKPLFTPAELGQFKTWAAKIAANGQKAYEYNLDYICGNIPNICTDYPSYPRITVGGSSQVYIVTNVTWSRAQALLGAAAAGGGPP